MVQDLAKAGQSPSLLTGLGKMSLKSKSKEEEEVGFKVLGFGLI
jgi:hypothetical protein